MTTIGKYLIRKDADSHPEYPWFYTWTGPEEDRDYGSTATWPEALASVQADIEKHTAPLVSIHTEHVYGNPLVGCARCGREIGVGEPALIVEEASLLEQYVGAVCADCMGDKGSIRCPTAPTAPDGTPHTVIGCGSTNIEWDPRDRVYDCLDCGIFFDPNGERR